MGGGSRVGVAGETREGVCTCHNFLMLRPFLRARAGCTRGLAQLASTSRATSWSVHRYLSTAESALTRETRASRVDSNELVGLFDAKKLPTAEDTLTPLLLRLEDHRQYEDAWLLYQKVRNVGPSTSAPALSVNHYRRFLELVSKAHQEGGRSWKSWRDTPPKERTRLVERDMREAGLYDERDAQMVATLISLRTRSLDFQGATAIFEGALAAAAAAREPLHVRIASKYILTCAKRGRAEEARKIYDQYVRSVSAAAARPLEVPSADEPSASAMDGGDADSSQAEEASRALGNVMSAYARCGDLSTARALLEESPVEVRSWHLHALLLACLHRARQLKGTNVTSTPSELEQAVVMRTHGHNDDGLGARSTPVLEAEAEEVAEAEVRVASAIVDGGDDNEAAQATAESSGQASPVAHVAEVMGAPPAAAASLMGSAAEPTPIEEARALFESYDGWERVLRHAASAPQRTAAASPQRGAMGLTLLIQVHTACGDTDGALALIDEAERRGALVDPSVTDEMMITLANDNRPGHAWRLYDDYMARYGAASVRVITRLTAACYRAADEAPSYDERKLWMERSMRLFADGQSLGNRRQEMHEALGVPRGGPPSGTPDAQAALLDGEGWAGAGGADGTVGPLLEGRPSNSDINRMSIPELRRFALASDLGIDLQTGGHRKRTRHDIVRDILAALSAREPLPVESLAVVNPALVASRLDFAAERLEKKLGKASHGSDASSEDAPALRAPMRGRQRTANELRRIEEGRVRAQGDWNLSDSGRLYQANKRIPFWVGQGQGGEEMREEMRASLEKHPPLQNTKAAWNLKKQTAKQRQRERDNARRRGARQ